MDQKGISNFEFSHKRFHLVKRDEMIFIISSSVKTKYRNAQAELKTIIKKFVARFPPEQYKNFNGEITSFKNFRSCDEIPIDQVIYKFKKAFW
jgi:hypothetical protein